jgi:hypothetical protein
LNTGWEEEDDGDWKKIHKTDRQRRKYAIFFLKQEEIRVKKEKKRQSISLFSLAFVLQRWRQSSSSGY